MGQVNGLIIEIEVKRFGGYFVLTSIIPVMVRVCEIFPSAVPCCVNAACIYTAAWCHPAATACVAETRVLDAADGVPHFCCVLPGRARIRGAPGYNFLTHSPHVTCKN